jgi:hypothetical protein
MKSRVFARLAISTVAMLLGLTTWAFAGPPLICHPLQVGDAKLLPLIDWNEKGTGGYNLKSLSLDTLTILDSNVPVLFRMETLRRATIYARHDSQVAKELLTRMHERANNSSGQSEALAWFDLGYLTEAYKQWLGKDGSNPAAGLDGYAWVKKAISLRDTTILKWSLRPRSSPSQAPSRNIEIMCRERWRERNAILFWRRILSLVSAIRPRPRYSISHTREGWKNELTQTKLTPWDRSPILAARLADGRVLSLLVCRPAPRSTGRA